jgi:K+-transporting ATPase KdpF subunit
MKAQKVKSVLSAASAPLAIQVTGTGESSPAGYLAGSVIALFILAYLIYTLFKPEKF